MKAAVFYGNKKIVTEDRPLRDLKENEVLVRVKAAGICGTDVHIYHGEAGSAEVHPPVILGHEFAGIVEAVGDAVTLVRVGDHVALDPNMYCGSCLPCRMGRKQNCEHLYALGVNADGGFAEYCISPESQCFVVDSDLDFKVAAMAEPLSCVIHGIDNAAIKAGQSVLVIGGGTIGLLMVQMAKLSGASHVLLSEPIEMRRKIGLEVGADATIDPLKEDVPERIREILGRDGVDVVIECVGRPFAVEQAFAAAGFRGTILLFSVPRTTDTVPLPLFDVYKKELNIVGSMINPDTFQRAVNLLNAKALKVDRLITHSFDVEHLEDAILMQMSSESIKVILEP
jgi:2-desacetyl-2-hydroxyethyl bacteriochlorophyllide A dehydrogenase